MKVSRRAPCPCGSGRKAKRCCGDPCAQERSIAVAEDALRDVVALPGAFPLLRPACPTFDDWARGRGDDDLVRADFEAGIAALGDGERKRIVQASAPEWTQLAVEVGDEEIVVGALLMAAVAWGVRDLAAPDEDRVAVVEEMRGLDPIQALGLVLDGTALWSVVEAANAAGAIHAWEPDELRAAAHRLWSPEHEARLARLVAYLRPQLPIEGAPRASRLLERGCEAAGRSETARGRLAALLLGEAVGALVAAGLDEAA